MGKESEPSLKEKSLKVGGFVLVVGIIATVSVPLALVAVAGGAWHATRKKGKE